MLQRTKLTNGANLLIHSVSTHLRISIGDINQKVVFEFQTTGTLERTESIALQLNQLKVGQCADLKMVFTT